MVFTFTAKELALERIKVICIDDVNFDNAIDEFDIDKAHCFSPLEEAKLRYILLNIVKKDEIYRFIGYLKGLVDAGRVFTVKESKLNKYERVLSKSTQERVANRIP